MSNDIKPTVTRASVLKFLRKLVPNLRRRRHKLFPCLAMRRGVSVSAERRQRRARHEFIAHSVNEGNEVAAHRRTHTRAEHAKFCYGNF